mgnify:CR=1 FL=1
MARITGCRRIVLAVVCACLMLAGCSRPILKPPVPRPLSEGGRVALDSRAKGHVGGNGFWTKDRLAQAVRGAHPPIRRRRISRASKSSLGRGSRRPRRPNCPLLP